LWDRQQKELRFLAKLNPEGHAASDRWIGQAEAGDWDALVEDLLIHHYDPSYAKAWVRNYSAGPSGGLIEVEVCTPRARSPVVPGLRSRT
jgi:hypothetical protein